MRLIILEIAALLLLAGCGGGMKVENFAGRTPELRLEEYFVGRIKGSGLFEDRFGTVRRTFTFGMTGRMDGNTLILEEDFLYNDGERQQRVWRLTRTGEGAWEGRADDVVGVGVGRGAGNAFQLAYTLKLPVGGSVWEVRFDDWLFRLDEETVLNRANVYRWGIWVGQVITTMRKLPEG
ncbi:MAG: DUF3833 domain-containing protein [Elioraea sp.]|nr:DUF3833 domain-containing protein [Elioraea sp.]